MNSGTRGYHYPLYLLIELICWEQPFAEFCGIFKIYVMAENFCWKVITTLVLGLKVIMGDHYPHYLFVELIYWGRHLQEIRGGIVLTRISLTELRDGVELHSQQGCCDTG